MSKLFTSVFRSLTLIFLLFSALELSAAGKKEKFKPIKDKIKFAGLDFVRYETEHFVILCDDGGERNYAKNLEAVYEFTLKQLPKFDEILLSNDSNSGKVVMIFIGKKDDYSKFGKWYSDACFRAGQQKIGEQASAVWDDTAGSPLMFFNKENEELSVNHPVAYVIYSMKEKKALSARVSHYTASHLETHYSQIKNKRNLPFWMTASYGYMTEITLCKHSGTTYLDYRGYEHNSSYDEEAAGGGGGRSQSKIFANGKSWARLVKKIMKDKKQVKPSLRKVLEANVSNCDAARSAYIYAFTCYLTLGDDRKKLYEQAVEAISKGEDSEAVLLRLYKFKSLAEMQDDWYKFMLGRDFK